MCRNSAQKERNVKMKKIIIAFLLMLAIACAIGAFFAFRSASYQNNQTTSKTVEEHSILEKEVEKTTSDALETPGTQDVPGVLKESEELEVEHSLDIESELNQENGQSVESNASQENEQSRGNKQHQNAENKHTENKLAIPAPKTEDIRMMAWTYHLIIIALATLTFAILRYKTLEIKHNVSKKYE